MGARVTANVQTRTRRCRCAHSSQSVG
jgi:hypothetical protein